MVMGVLTDGSGASVQGVDALAIPARGRRRCQSQSLRRALRVRHLIGSHGAASRFGGLAATASTLTTVRLWVQLKLLRGP
jgi:hypothetical protein